MAQNGSSPDEEEKVLQKKLESIQREKRKLLLKNKIQEESQELERLGEGEKPESPKRGTLFSWPPESRWRWALGFSMQTGRGLSQSTLRFQNELYSISDSELEGTESGLGFEARRLYQNSWGGIFGVSFSSEVSYLFSNLVYKWNNFYLPFGFNFSNIDLDISASSLPSNVTITDTSGGLGAQYGVGWSFNNNIALELLSTLNKISVDFNIDGERATLDTFYRHFTLAFRYIF